jgi:hypothetical protein
VLATARGAIKRVNLADLAAAAQANPVVIKLDADDELVWAATSSGGAEIMLITAGGQAIRFAEDEVRAMGLPAGGIAGIKLQASDRVVGGAVLSAANGGLELATVTAAGYGRRSPLKEFPAKGRGTQGVAAKLATKSGVIVSAFLVSPDDKLQLVTVSEQSKPLSAKSLPSAGRTNVGKAVVVLAAGEQVERAVLLPANGIEPAPPVKRGNGATGTTPRAKKEPAKELAPNAAAPKAPVANDPAANAADRTTAKAGATPTGATADKPRAARSAPAAEPLPVAAPSPAPSKVNRVAPPAGTLPLPGADADDVLVRRGKPAAMASQSPHDEVVSRKGQPASIARPGGEPGAATGARAKAAPPTGGQMLLVPEEPAAPAKSRARAKAEPSAPTAGSGKASSPARMSPRATTTPVEKPVASAKAAPPAEAGPSTKATPSAKAAPSEKPAAKPSKTAAKDQPEVKAPAKPPSSRRKRVPEAEFEPKPKSVASKPDKPGAAGLQTTWSPSPPRTPDEPESKRPKRK